MTIVGHFRGGKFASAVGAIAVATSPTERSGANDLSVTAVSSIGAPLTARETCPITWFWQVFLQRTCLFRSHGNFVVLNSSLTCWNLPRTATYLVSRETSCIAIICHVRGGNLARAIG